MKKTIIIFCMILMVTITESFIVSGNSNLSPKTNELFTAAEDKTTFTLQALLYGVACSIGEHPTTTQREIITELLPAFGSNEKFNFPGFVENIKTLETGPQKKSDLELIYLPSIIDQINAHQEAIEKNKVADLLSALKNRLLQQTITLSTYAEVMDELSSWTINYSGETIVLKQIEEIRQVLEKSLQTLTHSFKEVSGLTPRHEAQLQQMPYEKLELLVQEWTSGKRRYHHKVLTNYLTERYGELFSEMVVGQIKSYENKIIDLARELITAKHLSTEEPAEENVVWLGAEMKNGKAFGGTKAGTFSKQELPSKIRKQYPDCVITHFSLDNRGGCRINNNTLWFLKRGYENALVTLVVRQGTGVEVYDQAGLLLYPQNVVYVEAQIRDGKRLGGQLLDIYPDKHDLKQKVLKEHSNFIIEKFLLTSKGACALLGLTPVYLGHPNELVTVDIKGGQLALIFDEAGTQLYPPQNNLVYLNAKINPQGKREGGTFFQSVNHVNRLKQQVVDKGNSDFIVENFYLDSKGQCQLLGEVLWGNKKGYEGKPVTVVVRGGKPVEVYDRDGTQIYPYKEDENIVWINAEFQEGKILRTTKSQKMGPFKNKHDISTGVLHKGLTEFIVENFYLTPKGNFELLNSRFVNLNYAAQSVVVQVKNGQVDAVYAKNGAPIYQRPKLDQARELLRQLYDSGELDKLTELFGFNPANRILLGMIGKQNISPELLLECRMSFVYKTNGKRNSFKRKRVSTADEFVEELNSLPGIFLKDNVPLLSEEIIPALYRVMVKDSKFLKTLEQACNNSKYSPNLRACLQKAFEYYREYGKIDLEGVVKSPLKYYQKAGVKFILDKKRIILADEPGLGKTIQALAASAKIGELKGRPCKTLIISPSISKTEVWNRQIEEHLKGEPDVFVVNHRTQLDNKKTFKKISGAQYVIVNYELIRGPEAKELREKLKSLGFDFIVVDEAHRLRNDSQTTQAVLEFSAEYKTLITGTPLIGRRPSKLFYLLNWLRPDLFPDKNKFHFNFSSVSSLDEFHTRLKEFMLRRYAEDVLDDLPELDIEVIQVPLTEDQKIISQQIEKGIEDLIEKTTPILSHIIQLRETATSATLIPEYCFYEKGSENSVFLIPGQHQIILNGESFQISRYKSLGVQSLKVTDSAGNTVILDNKHPFLKVGKNIYRLAITNRKSKSNKYKELDTIVDSIVKKQAEKLVVFTGFVDAVEELKKRYQAKGIPVQIIHGSTRNSDREAILNHLNHSSEPMLLICTYQTTGESVDLTGAKYGVILNEPWTYQDKIQIIKRLHRYGQKFPVKFWVMTAQGSIESHIEKVLAQGYLVEQMVLNDPTWDEQISGPQIDKTYSEILGRLKELQKKTRRKETKILFSEIQDEELKISFKEGLFTATLKDNKELLIEIKDIGDLLEKSSVLSLQSKLLLNRFINERFISEKQSDIPVKQMLLWHLMEKMIPGFQSIDYDGRLEAIVELGTHVLLEVCKNPGIDAEKISEKMGMVSRDLLEDTLYYLDGANVFKLFSLWGLLPAPYYYREGKLLEFPVKLQIYYQNERIVFRNKWIINQIAPGHKGRDLTPEEEMRLCRQMESGNLEAEDVLVSHHMHKAVKAAKNAKWKVDEKFNVNLTENDLTSFANQLLVQKLRTFVSNAVYKRMRFEEYLQTRMNPQVYSQAYTLASQQKELKLDRPRSDEKDSESFINTIGDTASLSGKQSSANDSAMYLGHAFYSLGFDSKSQEVILFSYMDQCSEKEIADKLDMSLSEVRNILTRFKKSAALLGAKRMKQLFMSPRNEDATEEIGTPIEESPDNSEDAFESVAFKVIGPPLSTSLLKAIREKEADFTERAMRVPVKTYTIWPKNFDGKIEKKEIAARVLYVDKEELPEGIEVLGLGQETNEPASPLLLAMTGTPESNLPFIQERLHHEWLDLGIQNELNIQKGIAVKSLSSDSVSEIKRKSHILASYLQVLSFCKNEESGDSDTYQLINSSPLDKMLIKDQTCVEQTKAYISYVELKFIDNTPAPLLSMGEELSNYLSTERPLEYGSLLRLIHNENMTFKDIEKLKKAIAEAEFIHFLKKQKDSGFSTETLKDISLFIDDIGPKEMIVLGQNLGKLRDVLLGVAVDHIKRSLENTFSKKTIRKKIRTLPATSA